MTDTFITQPITAPLTAEQADALCDENGYLTVVVTVGLDVLVDNDLEGVLDTLSDLVTGTPLLMDVAYAAVGVTPDGDLLVRVTGDTSNAY